MQRRHMGRQNPGVAFASAQGRKSRSLSFWHCSEAEQHTQLRLHLLGGYDQRPQGWTYSFFNQLLNSKEEEDEDELKSIFWW